MARPLHIVAVGDLSFNSDYHCAFARRGIDFPFLLLSSARGDGSFLFGNLESPITGHVRASKIKLTLRGAQAAVDSLKAASFDCVSLANNHMMDFGPEGLAETCEHLDHAGIKHVGAGANLAEATSPMVLRKDSQSVGMLAFCDVKQDSNLYAGPSSAGVARADLATCLSAVRRLRPTVDWVVVQMHWGVELSQLPSPEQRTIAAALVEAGADVVLGHHPHVLQPVEMIHNSPVLYSLGDFAFSSTYWYGDKPSGERFLGFFEVHPFSRRTAWAEVVLQRGQPSRVHLHPAYLRPDLSVVLNRCREREQEEQRVNNLIVSPRFEQSFAEERLLAAQRDKWRFDGKRWRNRVRLKLLRWRVLRNEYVEPNDLPTDILVGRR